jgi:RES domain-containing protein
MIVYRISKPDHIHDLSGTGPRLYGGRWNPKGVSVIYTSESRALALLELYVHAGHRALPPGLKIVTIKIPETASNKEILLSDLPRDWRAYPAPPELATIGAKWVKSMETLLLRVPSAVMPFECNVIINPAHLEMKYVQITEIEEYLFDERLLS